MADPRCTNQGPASFPLSRCDARPLPSLLARRCCETTNRDALGLQDQPPALALDRGPGLENRDQEVSQIDRNWLKACRR